MAVKSSPPAVAAIGRRRRRLAAAAFSLLALNIVAFPWSLMAIQALADGPAAAARSDQQKQTEPEGGAHPRSVELQLASLDGGNQAPEREATYRHVGIGLAENSWDFSVPDGVPGFGPLDPADARRVLLLLGR